MIPKDIVIVIGRTFGSGGRHVGKIVADRLGLKYYDREILSEAAERLGFDKSIFFKADEKRPSPLRSLFSSSIGMPDQCSTGGLTREKIYEAQGNVIRDLAKDGGCVFVGRSADYILRDTPHLMSVFLHAPLERRAQNIVDRKEATSVAKAKEMAKVKDRDREGFYNYFTGRRWGTVDNYHLTIDSSLLSEEDIASLIVSHIDMRFK